MDKKQFIEKLTSVVETAINERAELDDEACLVVNPADMEVYVVDVEGEDDDDESLDFYPLIDLTLMDVEGNMHVDSAAIAEVADNYIK